MKMKTRSFSKYIRREISRDRTKNGKIRILSILRETKMRGIFPSTLTNQIFIILLPRDLFSTAI